MGPEEIDPVLTIVELGNLTQYKKSEDDYKILLLINKTDM